MPGERRKRISWLRDIVVEGTSRELIQVKAAAEEPVRTRTARPAEKFMFRFAPRGEHTDSIGMRNDCLRAAAKTVRLHGFRHHCEGFARACRLSGRVGNARFGSALVHMLVDAGRILCHGGRCQEWRHERYCENVFHDFSPAFDRKRLICALVDKFGADRRPVTAHGDLSLQSRIGYQRSSFGPSFQPAKVHKAIVPPYHSAKKGTESSAQ